MKIYEKDFTKPVFYLLILSTLFIHSYNFFHYTPMLGYDAEAHYSYIDNLAKNLPRKFQLPTFNETREFFSPPLPYIFPSIVQIFCRNLINSSDFLRDCKPVYSDFTQIFQILIYFLVILINLGTFKKIFRTKSYFFSSFLILFSMLSVNYRTFSMIRGEPYIVLLLSVLIYQLVSFSEKNFKLNSKEIFMLGLTIGLLALSKQWAFLIFPSFFIVLQDKKIRSNKKYLKFIASSFFVGFLASSWFYLNLYIKYGSFTAFNLESLGFNLNNKPIFFYFPNSEYLIQLFKNPVRPNLSNQFLTSFYADIWTDYWGYFSFTSKFLDIGRSQLTIGKYFAYVNLFSIITTSIIFYYWKKSLERYKDKFYIKIIKISVYVSLVGFLWFVISYPEPAGDTVKATYMLQLFYLVVFVSALGLENLKIENIKKYNQTLIILLLIYFFNYQTYLSHFPRIFVKFLNL